MLPLGPALVDDGVDIKNGAATGPVLAIGVLTVAEQVSFFEEAI